MEESREKREIVQKAVIFFEQIINVRKLNSDSNEELSKEFGCNFLACDNSDSIHKYTWLKLGHFYLLLNQFSEGNFFFEFLM